MEFSFRKMLSKKVQEIKNKAMDDAMHSLVKEIRAILVKARQGLVDKTLTDKDLELLEVQAAFFHKIGIETCRKAKDPITRRHGTECKWIELLIKETIQLYKEGKYSEIKLKEWDKALVILEEDEKSWQAKK